MASKVQLTGGNFQDSMGNLLVNGYLTMRLSSDEEVNDSLICSGIELRIQLDSNGDVVTSPAQSVWGNDVMLPVNSYYIVTGYTASGQMAWGPNNQQVEGAGPFDTGTWIPNQVISWTPPLQVPLIEVNGTEVATQSPINFEDSATVTFSNPSEGNIQATASIPPLNYLPTPQSARFGMWQAASSGLGNFLTILDALNVGGAGAVHNAPTASSGAYNSYTDDFAANGDAWIYTGRKVTFRSAVHVTASGTTAQRIWGISDQTVGTGPTLPTAGNCICVSFLETTGGLGNWLLVTSIGGSITVVDSGIPVVSGTQYAVEFIINAGTITLYVNETAVATSTTYDTTAACSMCYYQHRTGGFVDFTTDIQYFYAENVTP